MTSASLRRLKLGIPAYLPAVLIAASAVSLCQETQPQVLTLDDCVRLALEAPSSVHAVDRGQSIAREQQTAARAEMLPQFGVSAGYVYNSPLTNGPNPFSFVALNGIREYLATADARWAVDLSGRLRAGLALARAGRDIAVADLEIARRDLRRAVTLAYFDMLLARRLVALEQAGLAEVSEFERRVSARLEQGDASRADLLKASAQRSQFEQRVSRARLNATLANQVLASFWTANVDTELAVEDVLDLPPPGVLEPGPGEAVAAVERRPELDRLDAAGRSADAQRKIAQAGAKPQADVVFQYGFDVNQVQSRQRGYAAYVNLSLPIFDWFRTRSGVRAARFQREQVDFERASAERALTREYFAARSRVSSSQERISMAQSEFNDSRENLRLVRLLYDNGEGSALDVVLSQSQVTEAGGGFYAAVAEYHRAFADYEAAAGL